MDGKPNVVYVFSDQHRSEASGYAGNPDVRTPHLDRLASESICFKTAVSGLPLCCASRASLLTGQYPLTHGVFVNDVPIGQNAVSVAEAFAAGGYDTAYIGKWHVDGRGRSEFIPQERRLGFAFWRGMECTHDYNESYYYAYADEPVKRKWEGYDAEAQTRCAQSYIKNRDKAKPFVLFLSWGPPHNPYDAAPEPYKQLYDPAKLTLRGNIPKAAEEQSRKELAGYYAHITALDALIGQLRATLAEENIDEDTIFVYTSDHGDMLGSQGRQRKQWPWDESILVPFLLRY
ncbi:MAG: Arylsulfatase, partial [Paenibacillus sp.]|nr:Arylsulfatase [Paenibacillus sp.]